MIKNDPEGFYNYLTAPNIRHKVKHPVFLAIKFSNCVQILYNSEILENMNVPLIINSDKTAHLKSSKETFEIKQVQTKKLKRIHGESKRKNLHLLGLKHE